MLDLTRPVVGVYPFRLAPKAVVPIIGVMDLVATRYTNRSWPAYCFRPGKHPHPTAHPQGHSYVAPGADHPEFHLGPAEDWALCDDYLFACDLYNHGYWWEAHETWEGMWQQSDKAGVQGHFLQGLIQVSACHLKLWMANLRGVLELLAKSSEHLGIVIFETSQRPYMGLPLAAWNQEVWDYYDAILGRAPLVLEHSPKYYPYIRLVVRP